MNISFEKCRARGQRYFLYVLFVVIASYAIVFFDGMNMFPISRCARLAGPYIIPAIRNFKKVNGVYPKHIHQLYPTYIDYSLIFDEQVFRYHYIQNNSGWMVGCQAIGWDCSVVYGDFVSSDTTINSLFHYAEYGDECSPFKILPSYSKSRVFTGYIDNSEYNRSGISVRGQIK